MNIDPLIVVQIMDLKNCEDLQSVLPHSDSAASSSDGECLLETIDEDFEYNEIDGENSSGVASDNDAEDFAYYQDVYRFVTTLKSEFIKRKQSVGWNSIQKKKDEVKEELQRKTDVVKEELQRKTDVVKEAVKTSKDRISEKGREKLEHGRKSILQLQRRTYKRLKKLEPEENSKLKVIFTKSVLTLVLKTFATCSGQWLLPWYYAFTCPCLIIWRIITYWQAQFQYFCLDFCYFGNLIISLILWFAPSSPELCALQFSIANGMLYLGAFSFRNSLVFHSVDKMTSTYIHTVPLLLTFGIRWFPEETSRFWHDSFPEAMEPSIKWNVLGPFAVLIAHSLLYTLLVNVILQPEEHIVTSFRYLRAKKGVKKVFGPDAPYIVFLVVNMVLCLLFSSLTMLMYKYFFVHVISLIVLLMYITWNGAGYYFEIFRMSLEQRQSSNEKED